MISLNGVIGTLIEGLGAEDAAQVSIGLFAIVSEEDRRVTLPAGVTFCLACLYNVTKR